MWTKRELANILGAVKIAKIIQNKKMIEGVAKESDYWKGYLSGCQDILDILARSFGISVK